MSRKIHIILFYSLLVLSSVNGYGQNMYSRYEPKMIKGVVLNKNTRVPVPSAEVKVIKTDYNGTYSTRTDEKGIYFIDPMGLGGFILEVKKFGYLTYISGTFITSLIIEKNNYQVDEILLDPSIVYPPPKDTVKRPPQEYLERQFASLDLLPTPSAYQLFYDLNPELLGMALVDPDYKIILPKTPVLPADLRRQFSDNFKKDFKEDAGMQAILKDSILFFNRLYDNFLYTTTIRYHSTDKDSARRTLAFINDDLKSYLPEVRNTKRGKAAEAIKLVNSSCIILSAIVQKQEFTEADAFYLKHLGLQLSLILFFEKSRSYFSGTERTASRTYRNTDAGSSSFIWASYNESPENNEPPVGNPDLRALNITIHLSKDGRVISDGPDVLKRFLVVCYPPALKSIESTHRTCNSPATFANITLSNAPYEFMIFDLHRPGKQMKFIKSNSESEIISTEEAFNEMARTMLGVNTKGLAFYIKED